MVVLTSFVVVVVVVVMNTFLIDRGADQSVLVLGGPRVHVDLESSRRHLVADRVFNTHGEAVRILQR